MDSKGQDEEIVSGGDDQVAARLDKKVVAQQQAGAGAES
jgi:hypothetical protein